jgi:hypothetical protein
MSNLAGVGADLLLPSAGGIMGGLCSLHAACSVSLQVVYRVACHEVASRTFYMCTSSHACVLRHNRLSR